MSYGLSISVHDTLVTKPAGSSEPPWLFDITGDVSSYSHVSDASMGYVSASFQMNVTREEVNDWMEHGLLRHIRIFASNNKQVWEGFVNQLAFEIGGYQITRGPLTNVANRVSVLYVPILDPTADPPVLGTRTETLVTEDAFSQGRYGIIEKVITTGNCFNCTPYDAITNPDGMPWCSRDADAVRDTYIQEYKEPETSHDISIGNSRQGVITMRVDCLGYSAWFDLFTYRNDLDADYSVWISDKIKAILQYEHDYVNGFFPDDFSDIADNALLTDGRETEWRTASSIIKPLLAFGDVNDKRYVFGIRNGRKAYYQMAPETPEYFYYVYSDGTHIIDKAGGDVDPALVEPGKWLLISDVLGGKVYYNRAPHATDDPRMIFIESVQYSAPNGVTINGSKLRYLPQKIARLGLGGIT